MGQPEFVTSTDTSPSPNAGFSPAGSTPADRLAPAPTAADHVAAAASARSAEWSADAAVDFGDCHDKGEASLCVGEAV